ncbi:MAG: cyclic nucleotide-binding domain-containing protein [Nocardioides sp.]|nr:cyclic nucleotide-binding domain-containing protein [Nocardioides sp.]
MTSILDQLTPADARTVLAAGTPLTLPAGWSPIAEGTPADKAYLITEGEVSVRQAGQEIARLGAGSLVGEAAIVNHRLRSATVVALTPLRVVHFTSARLADLLTEVPAFGEAVVAAASARVGGH